MAANTRTKSVQDPNNGAAAHCGRLDLPKLDEQKADELVAGFKAAGNSVRLRILDILSRQGGEVCVCDIEEQFDLSQPTISHHLRVLRDAGLVESERRGTWIYYFIRPGRIDQMRSLLTGFLAA